MEVDCVLNELDKANVVAVVVTYNRKELLRECLISLLNQTYKNLRILVVDNFSTDNTHNHIKDLIDENKNLEYINTGSNLGGAGGFNFGIKESLKFNPSFIWVMDDDSLPTSDALTKLINYGKKINNNFGFLSSKVLRKDKSMCLMNIPRISISKEIKDYDKDQKIILGSFVSTIFNVDAIEEVGLPIKDFFIWGDDWEYTRCISKSYPCYYVSDSVVIHQCKENKGVSIVNETERLNRYFYAYRNEGYFYRKSGLNGLIYYFIKVVYHFLAVLLKSRNEKLNKLKIILNGMVASFKFHPKIEYSFANEKSINVSIFFGEPISYGGQEAFMLNMLNSFSDQNIIYTIATPFKCDNTNFLNFENKKIKIISYNKKFDTVLRKHYIKKCFKDFLKQNKSEVVHIQSGSLYVLYYLSKLAYKNNVKKVIIHSHCAGTSNLKYRLIKHVSDKKIDKYVNVYLACSNLAAEWKFPKEIINEKKFKIIFNGINTNKFKFNDEIRTEYRNKLNLNGYLTLCNVGRLSEQKNQKFLVDICDLLKRKNVKFKCLVVGDGELKNDLIKKVEDKKLTDYIVFLSRRNDIANIMMAADIFLLPSIYEGLAVTTVESQATGLPTLCSSTITKETNLTDLIKFLPINDANIWANEILRFAEKKFDREIYANMIKQSGYDSKQSAKLLEEIYRGLD